MESYKKRLEERKKIRGILNNCGLRQDWLTNKSGKTELESRVLKRMQLKGRPEITIKEVSSKASVWQTFWNFLLSVLVNTLDFSSRLGLLRHSLLLWGSWFTGNSPHFVAACLFEVGRITQDLLYTNDPGEGSYQQSLIRVGRLYPKVQPLTLLYTIFHKKKVPLSCMICFQNLKWYPFHMPAV